MKKKLLLILLALVLCAGLAVGIIAMQNSKKTKLNDSYVNGNTAGNLYNAGLVCEYNGIVYFANPSDEYRLYSMNSDGTDLKKINDDVATFINADAHYLYYIRNNPRTTGAFSFLQTNSDSLCRINRDGKGDVLILEPEPSLYASLIGNYIYYLRYDKEDATSLYKIKIDGTEQRQISHQPYFTCCTNGQYLLYNGLDGEHYIRQFDTTDYTETVLSTSNTWMPTVIGNTAYFIDVDNNYSLAREDLTDNSKVTLTTDRIDCYHVYGSYIYFQRNSRTEPALCRIRTDGSDYEVIMDGVYTDINADSTYIYFRDFNSHVSYRVPVLDNSAVEIFNPGKIEDKKKHKKKDN